MKDEVTIPGLPDEFIERLALILPDALRESCLASFADDKPVGLRANTLKAAVDDVFGELARGGLELQRVAWLAEAGLVPPDQRRALLDSAAVREGRVYVQNLASMLVPLVLAPRPGEEVLDLAAAPGGKTLQMAAMMRNQGRIAAVEPIRDRFYRLRAALALHGAAIVSTYRADGRTIGHKTPERFDRVLLDAPCSCEARFDTRDPESWHYWSPRKIKESARKQKGLLRSAAMCLKPGGTLVYSTCTFAPEENELVVQSLLDELDDAVEIAAIDCPLPNLQPGLSAWQGRALHPGLARAVRVLPTRAMDAAFVCKLVKRAGSRPTRRRGRKTPIS